MDSHYADLWHRVALSVPSRPAIVTVGGATLDYRAFDDAAARLAAAWRARGIAEGDKIAIVMHNRPEWLIAFYAALKLGAAPVALNFRARAPELAALLADCDAVAVVYPATLAEVIGESVATLTHRPLLFEVDDVGGRASDADVVDFDTYRSVEPLAPSEAPDGELFLYTGGTTGAPKGVVWGVRDLLATQIFNAYVTVGLEAPSSPGEVVRIAIDPATPHLVLLPLAPLMHGTALTNTMNALLLGGTIVIMPTAHFDPEWAYRVIRDEAVTRIVVAGDAIAIPLLDALDARGVTALPAVESIVSSGMRFSDATKERIHSLGAIRIGDILASTEGGALAIAMTQSASDLPSRLRLTPGAVVLDDLWRDVSASAGSIGRIAYSGGMPKGYYKDPVKTAETFLMIDGRRHVVPGDLVRVLEDRFVELLGRGSSVVNSGGEKVFPAEVEESLMRHPLVDDAIVFGVPDPRWGEVVAAAVVVSDPVAVTEAELITHVGMELAGYKKPRILYVVRDLERGPTGKVDLARLRDRLGRERMGA